MRKWELIKQSPLLKIKSQILSDLFNEKYGLRLGEFKNTTGTERVKGKVVQLLYIVTVIYVVIDGFSWKYLKWLAQEIVWLQVSDYSQLWLHCPITTLQIN